jgi:aminopeptidase
MGVTLQTQQQKYAELLIHIGVNLQPGQSLRLGAELGHAEFARLVNAAAYRAGARYVHMDWLDSPSARNRLLYSQPDDLDYLPNYEIKRHREMVNDHWARLSLVGAEFPDIFNDVDPAAMRRVAQIRTQKLKFYQQAQMANQLQWCVASAPTAAWAQKVFPDLASDAAVERLWQVILQTVRSDCPDPIAAWRQQDEQLRRVVQFMAHHQVCSLHFVDPTPAADGVPSTDLQVGLTDFPVWVAASSLTPRGVRFLPNMPTEEVFTTPHNQRTEGWVHTSKPCFPFERRVEDAYFRFSQGELVEFRAANGQEVLEQFFQIRGARRLGEISLVDVRSPINQSGLTFFETLFDENAVCHLAFGEAYPEGVENGSKRSPEELAALGVNQADTHVDFMIGTSTMNVTGRAQDGHSVAIMVNGQFTPAVIEFQAT